MKNPVLVIIMDGFGISSETKGNAVLNAKTPNLDKIFNSSPYTELCASGLAVGLPKGQMGNSEVGHMNIGAGRTVLQDLTYIDKCIEDGSFEKNEKLCEIMNYALNKGLSIHLMGLCSDGAVHSSVFFRDGAEQYQRQHYKYKQELLHELILVGSPLEADTGNDPGNRFFADHHAAFQAVLFDTHAVAAPVVRLQLPPK